MAIKVIAQRREVKISKNPKESLELSNIICTFATKKRKNDEKTIIHGGNGTTGGWLLKQR